MRLRSLRSEFSSCSFRFAAATSKSCFRYSSCRYNISDVNSTRILPAQPWTGHLAPNSPVSDCPSR
eukprot:227181-Rhodomonas_salina.4